MEETPPVAPMLSSSSSFSYQVISILDKPDINDVHKLRNFVIKEQFRLLLSLIIMKKKIVAGMFLLALVLLYYMDAPRSPDSEELQESVFERENIQGKRVAICLVGEARHLELTGPSIRKYVLDPLKNNSDIFINVPLDRNSYKLLTLDEGDNFIWANVFKPQYIEPTRIFKEAMQRKGSPRGLQGLLQYFALNEGCESMIQEQEVRQGFTYDWIIRTRLDTFWTAPIPLDYQSGMYTVPLGTRYGGYNDRLGIGNRTMSRVALKRLSSLELLHSAGYRKLNSEAAFFQQLQLQNVKVAEDTFPFCVLSNRSFPWPPGRHTPLITSIQGKGPLNGAYCRPCTPSVSSRQARKVVGKMVDGWIPTRDVDLEICDGSGSWGSEWQEVFDAAAGDDAAATRIATDSMSRTQCISTVSSFIERWKRWNGPSAVQLCDLREH